MHIDAGPGAKLRRGLREGARAARQGAGATRPASGSALPNQTSPVGIGSLLEVRQGPAVRRSWPAKLGGAGQTYPSLAAPATSIPPVTTAHGQREEPRRRLGPGHTPAAGPLEAHPARPFLPAPGSKLRMSDTGEWGLSRGERAPDFVAPLEGAGPARFYARAGGRAALVIFASAGVRGGAGGPRRRGGRCQPATWSFPTRPKRIPFPAIDRLSRRRQAEGRLPAARGRIPPRRRPGPQPARPGGVSSSTGGPPPSA